MGKSSVKIIAIIVILIGISYFIAVYFVMPWHNTAVTIGSAMREIARAETAQTPDDVIYHVTNAKRILPVSGSISPADTDDFKTMQAELDDIIGRAKDISLLESDNAMYISEMFAMHARLKAIQETLLAF